MSSDAFKGLSDKQARFVQAYVKHGSQVAAAIEAGYSEHSARQIASELLNRNQAVMSAVDKVRSEVAEEAKYDLKTMASRLDNFIEKAWRAKQFTAVANMLQQLNKMFGHLDERIHLKVETVDIKGALEEAHARVLNYRNQLIEDAEIVEPTETTKEDSPYTKKDELDLLLS